MSEYAQLRGGAADASVEVDALSETEIATWSESQVRDWVASIPKCKRYAALFQEHEIEGSVLLGLTDTHLKEIGVDLVGPRAKLLQKLAGLKRGARVVRRQSSLWSARQHDGRSCADKCKQCNCCCPHGTRAARYKLTPTTLSVRSFDIYECAGVKCPCLGQKETRRRYDLADIAEVDSTAASRGCMCCSAGEDEVLLMLSVDGNADDDYEDEEELRLVVAPGEGARVAEIIRSAKHELCAGLVSPR